MPHVLTFVKEIANNLEEFPCSASHANEILFSYMRDNLENLDVQQYLLRQLDVNFSTITYPTHKFRKHFTLLNSLRTDKQVDSALLKYM